MNRVISIGYGRHIFEAGNIERERLSAAAAAVAHYDMVIFSKRQHGLQVEEVTESLTLHPTRSLHNITALFGAFLIARSIIKKSSTPVTLTTQDPFETALIGILLKKLYGVKLIIQEHGDFFSGPAWRKESLLNRLRYQIGLWTLGKADVVRVVSFRTESYLKGRGITHTVCLPVVIDTAAYKQDTVNVGVREWFSKDEFVFLSAARFVPQKNLTLLLHAFFAAQKKAPQIRLLLVGKGAGESELRGIIQKLSPKDMTLVQIIPWSDDVPTLMQTADAYALSSDYEGWGRVLIEAMVSELPTVTTDVGCAGTVMKHDEHGLVVPVGDEHSFSEAMVSLATNASLYAEIKTTLAALDKKHIPGTDSEAYAAQWARIFGQ